MADQSAILIVDGLQVHRGKKLVVDIPHLELRKGEALAIAGPNGAGKSTFLLAIAGLIKISSGDITLNQISIRNSPAAIRQHCALVLQEPLLLHDTVRENIGIGLGFRQIEREETRKRVDHWMEVFGIAHLAQRQAFRISGGEARRVSLARAFTTGADLLLLDEPFSSLDAPTRSTMINDFQSILKSSQQTAIFITHDLDEALMLGSRIAILIGGKLRQVGEPRHVFTEPADSAVADFVGVENVLPGEVASQVDGLTEVRVGSHLLETVSELPAGRSVYLCLRPEDITILHQPGDGQSSARNHISCVVTQILPKGPLSRVTMVNDHIHLVSLITRASAADMGLVPGMKVIASFKASAAHLLPR